MTTQHDERAELIRWLELEAIPHRPGSHSRHMLLKAAALLAADAQAGGEAVAVTDEMAYAFHRALTDGAISAEEVEEIKTGLRAALANYTRTQPQAVAQGWKPVPVEPTDAMVVQGLSASGRDVMESDVEDIYRAMLSASPSAPAAAQVAQEIEQLIRERDDRDEIIDRLCDAVLGEDRHEWSSAYGFDDAVADVEERINQLHQPSVDRAWTRFEQAHSQPAAQVAQPLTEEDIEEVRLNTMPNAWLEEIDAFTAGVRFAERRHGIGKDQAS